MNDQTREKEDAIFRDKIRKKHFREMRGSVCIPRSRPGRIKPLIVIERSRRGTDTWEEFTSTKNPIHAQTIVAEGENDAVYAYRIQQPANKPGSGSS